MQTKNEKIHISLQQSELSEIKKEAAALGITASEFIRAPVLAHQPIPLPDIDWNGYAKAIKFIGQKIDSLALSANGTQWVDPDMYDTLYERFEKLLTEVENELKRIKEL